MPSRWESISFPAMTPWRRDITRPRIVVENRKKEGMVLLFQYFLPPEADQETNGTSRPEPVAAEFYVNENKPVILKGTLESGPYEGSGPGPRGREQQTDHTFFIPWGANALDDAWVRLRLKDRDFWVELPFGFTRNPADPAPPAGESKEGPGCPVAKNTSAGENDLVIPWEYVTYQLDGFPASQRVYVNMANPSDAQTELQMSGFGSDIREPRCGITFEFVPDYRNEGRCISLAFSRGIEPWIYQMFSFPPGFTEGRAWIPVRIQTGPARHALTVPSSLTYSGHGHGSVPEGTRILPLAGKWNIDR